MPVRKHQNIRNVEAHLNSYRSPTTNEASLYLLTRNMPLIIQQTNRLDYSFSKPLTPSLPPIPNPTPIESTKYNYAGAKYGMTKYMANQSAGKMFKSLK